MYFASAHTFLEALVRLASIESDKRIRVQAHVGRLNVFTRLSSELAGARSLVSERVGGSVQLQGKKSGERQQKPNLALDGAQCQSAERRWRHHALFVPRVGNFFSGHSCAVCF